MMFRVSLLGGLDIFQYEVGVYYHHFTPNLHDQFSFVNAHGGVEEKAALNLSQSAFVCSDVTIFINAIMQQVLNALGRKDFRCLPQRCVSIAEGKV